MNGERWACLPAPERSALSARMDRLLWDLARTETLVERDSRLRALGVVAEDCAVFIEDLASLASTGGTPTPPGTFIEPDQPPTATQGLEPIGRSEG